MARSHSALLQVQQVTCGYAGRTVLSDVDFAVREGEIVAVLGTNGAGKSTLLKTLCRTIPASTGSVIIDLHDYFSMDIRNSARLVSYVPQEEEPKFGFTAHQIVAMGRFSWGEGLFESEEDHAIAKESLERVDASHLCDRPVNELSGGERQRVLIARALAQRAKVVLLDEPTAHLDIPHQSLLRKVLSSEVASGRAALVAVHDLNQAARLSDRMIVLDAGRVVLDAPTEEVLDSNVLEQVYGVPFQRHTDSKGRKWILIDEA